MLIDEFISKFKTYCQQRFPSETGTATSYTNAVKYLFEFMNASSVSHTLIWEVRSLEPDIRDANSILYNELNAFFSSTGRSSYLRKGFLKAALPVLFEFGSVLISQEDNNVVLSQEIRDNQIIADFSVELLKHELPTAEYIAHNYSVRRISGTSDESANKIRSGRKAEKYFTSFLTSLGFIKNQDFFDVANNKTYGYDIRFYDVGLEVKNINSGTFFLSDNEIARLENTDTHLVLVDIDNGIWFLKNNSRWLKEIISDIKKIRDYCNTHYSNIDPCDIKIIINNDIKNDVVDISILPKTHVVSLFSGGNTNAV